MYAKFGRCLFSRLVLVYLIGHIAVKARLAQSVERKALNLVVVGSSPTVGVFLFLILLLLAVWLAVSPFIFFSFDVLT